jgi:hypothetical protein
MNKLAPRTPRGTRSTRLSLPGRPLQWPGVDELGNITLRKYDLAAYQTCIKIHCAVAAYAYLRSHKAAQTVICKQFE